MKAMLDNPCQISPGKAELSTTFAKGTLEAPPQLPCLCSLFSQCWIHCITPGGNAQAPQTPSPADVPITAHEKGSSLFQVAPAVSDPEVKFILCSCPYKSIPGLQAKAAAATEGPRGAQGAHSCCLHLNQPGPVEKTQKSLKIPQDFCVCNPGNRIAPCPEKQDGHGSAGIIWDVLIALPCPSKTWSG